MHAIEVPSLPPNNSTYSQAVRLGDLIFVSGQLGLVPGGIREQTARAIENIEAILTAAGSSLSRVAKVNIFITDFTQLPAMNEIYAVRFPHRPAKTTVEVSRLDRDALIEIEVIAAAG